jgi:C4-dicarboxylate-specific signal transduction histidine kinase
MARAQYLATIGVMAAGIAHEINQPLNALTITVEGLDYQLQNNREITREVLQAKLKRISDQCRRFEKIILHMRALAKPSPASSVESTDIQAALDAVMPLLGNQLANQHIALTVNLAPAARRIMASPIQLEQVLVNLLANAMNALNLARRENKEIRIVSEPTGDRIRLTVSDNGIGLGDHGQRIFEPFFSASRDDTAMGLGLSIVSKFVYSWDGGIQASNNDQGGATFALTLRRG